MDIVWICFVLRELFIKFAVQFCGLRLPVKTGAMQETEVEKFGCLQPLKKMLKLHLGGAALREPSSATTTANALYKERSQRRPLFFVAEPLHITH